MVTVPTVEFPPAMLDGLRLSVTRLKGTMVNTALWLTPPNVPVIVADNVRDTAVVEIVNVADNAPAGTVTDD